MSRDRIAVFLDYQNVYHSARDAFCRSDDPPAAGHVDPLAVAERLVAMRSTPSRLVGVRVYRGLPERLLQPAAALAAVRQIERWERSPLVSVVARPLRYPRDWPAEKAREKGIDVALAIDFVTMAAAGEYDAGILFSTATDLEPALEAVVRLGVRAEVAAWSTGRHARRLSIAGARLWCHWLDREAYDASASL